MNPLRAALTLCVTLGALPALAQPADPVLRVCADPQNLPFSNQAGEGFENRIAQELVNNIVKHAEALHVSVNLARNNGSLVLSFRDDGRGFDRASQQQGAGITNIMTRAELIGGKALIESNPGQGTFVQLTVPL